MPRQTLIANITRLENGTISALPGRDRALLLAFRRNRSDAWCKPRYFVICVDGFIGACWLPRLGFRELDDDLDVIRLP